uniref:DUF6090 family protein n=1 Tax=Mariniflexile sp. TaxID=1979402 RepID=UPI00404773F9
MITIGILGAFGLGKWNENRKTENTEESVLREIKASLTLDLIDLKGNQDAHKMCLGLLDSLERAEEFGTSKERIALAFFRGFRDFIYLPQISAFETLKSKGVDIISNDSLRVDLLRLYDFYYTGMVVIEGEFQPSQFIDDYRYIVYTYYDQMDINTNDPDLSTISPKFEGYDWLKNGDVSIRIDQTQIQRRFLLGTYNQLVPMVEAMIERIDEELELN